MTKRRLILCFIAALLAMYSAHFVQTACNSGTYVPVIGRSPNAGDTHPDTTTVAKAK
jgi:hypothetical protein